MGTRQWVSVTVIKTPLQLVPDDKSIPAFNPSQAREFFGKRVPAMWGLALKDFGSNRLVSKKINPASSEYLWSANTNALNQ